MFNSELRKKLLHEAFIVPLVTTDHYLAVGQQAVPLFSKLWCPHDAMFQQSAFQAEDL